MNKQQIKNNFYRFRHSMVSDSPTADYLNISGVDYNGITLEPDSYYVCSVSFLKFCPIMTAVLFTGDLCDDQKINTYCTIFCNGMVDRATEAYYLLICSKFL